MKLLQRVVGPIATNLYVLGDEASGEAIAIDTATPCVEWLTTTLAERGWTLKLIVSTHWHWDHIGDNAATMEATGAELAAHTLDHALIENPPSTAPFPIPPSVPAIDLAEGSRIRFGAIDIEVLHTPGHTAGSVCLLVGWRAAAPDRRHALRGQLGPNRPARRQCRSDGRVAHPTWRVGAGSARAARPRQQEHDRDREALARPGGASRDAALVEATYRSASSLIASAVAAASISV